MAGCAPMCGGVLLYGDGSALYGSSNFDVQQTLVRLQRYLENANLQINLDILYVHSSPLEYVGHMNYINVSINRER